MTADITPARLRDLAKEVVHASDCSVHNGPALDPGPCDCVPGQIAVALLTAVALLAAAEIKSDRVINGVTQSILRHFLNAEIADKIAAALDTTEADDEA